MAIVDLNALSTEFPEGKIVLINGTVLDCYPKREESDLVVDGKMQLDTTGEFLSIGNKPSKCKKTVVRDPNELIFIEKAFLFYRNAARILSDSRMFLSPVPVRNGLAYTGTSGFQAPTLGIYIEWWLNCEVDVTKDRKGRDALTYHIAGSPLSGMNHCSCVYPDGKTDIISFPSPFIPVWQSFCNINNRYNSAKVKYDSYTLTEVVDILEATEVTRENELSTKLLIQEGKTNIITRKFDRLKEQFNSLKAKYDELCILFHKKQLEEFVKEYKTRHAQVVAEVAELDVKKAEFKAKMKHGEISNVEYQRLITPLRKRKEAAELELSRFKTEKINELIKSGYITYQMIEKYLHDNAN